VSGGKGEPPIRLTTDNGFRDAVMATATVGGRNSARVEDSWAREPVVTMVTLVVRSGSLVFGRT
jgi:hypothetical protein